MIVPGSNLLQAALSVIASQTVTYFAASGRTLNAVGQYVTTFATSVSLVGSFQPVPRALYQTYGLDLSKTYYTFYSSTNIQDVNRDVSGDQLEFNGKRFQCLASNDWFAIDGWTGILCVEIPS